MTKEWVAKHSCHVQAIPIIYFEPSFRARGHSSVVEHSTADREVPGSNPGAPCNYFS